MNNSQKNVYVAPGLRGNFIIGLIIKYPFQRTVNDLHQSQSRHNNDETHGFAASVKEQVILFIHILWAVC